MQVGAVALPAGLPAVRSEPAGHAQAQLLAQARRLLIPSHVPERRWWMKTGTAPTRHRGSTCAWVAGSDGTRTAVLHLPTGRGKAEGLARFHQLLGIPGPEVP